MSNYQHKQLQKILIDNFFYRNVDTSTPTYCYSAKQMFTFRNKFLSLRQLVVVITVINFSEPITAWNLTHGTRSRASKKSHI